MKKVINYKLKIKNSRLGFTLIEVLVVISIIAIASALYYGTFGPGLKKARDTERKSDIAKYKLALESFATQNNNFYPVSVATSRVSQMCASYFVTYNPDCPEDARYLSNSEFVYNYQSMGTNPADLPGTVAGLRWVMWSKLETIDRYWVSCSNGKNAEVATTGFIVTNANCPLP